MWCLLKAFLASLAAACHLQGLGDASVGWTPTGTYLQQQNSTLGVQEGPEASRIDLKTLYFCDRPVGAPSLGSVRAVASELLTSLSSCCRLFAASEAQSCCSRTSLYTAKAHFQPLSSPCCLRRPAALACRRWHVAAAPSCSAVDRYKMYLLLQMCRWMNVDCRVHKHRKLYNWAGRRAHQRFETILRSCWQWRSTVCCKFVRLRRRDSGLIGVTGKTAAQMQQFCGIRRCCHSYVSMGNLST